LNIAALRETLMQTHPGPVQLTDRALQIHSRSLVIDGHNDLPDRIRDDFKGDLGTIALATRPAEERDRLQTDIARLRRGGVGAQFWSAYVPPELDKKGGAARYCLEQIDLIRRMVARYPDVFEMAYTADDVERIRRSGKIASLIGIEGGHAIESSLGALRMFYALGARYITLTHADTTDWCDSATDTARHGGLTAFGEEVVAEMNRLGMLVDISHISADAMRDVLRVSKAPVIASHSSTYAIAAHPRNVPDDVLALMKEKGGVVMVNFFSGFSEPEAARRSIRVLEEMRELKEKYSDPKEREKIREERRRRSPLPRGTVYTIVDHIDHIVKVGGIDHAGLGSDFDGVSRLPEQLDDVSCYPFITQALLDRGYTEEQIHKINGGNVLSVLRQAENVAKSLQKK
jgi:membrane dipeptidase